MRPRTAIIALFILAVILFGALFYYIQTRPQNDKQSVSGESSSVKQLTPAEREERAIKMMENMNKNQSIDTKFKSQVDRANRAGKMMENMNK
jgi:hypothetical protein